MGEPFRNHSAKAAVTRKRLRAEMGVSERVFWEAIRKKRLGYQFKRQVSVGPYFLDFYCPAAMLAIELDGEIHKSRSVQDRRRDEYLAGVGIEVLRIPTLDLFEKTGVLASKWLTVVEKKCADRVGRFKQDLLPTRDPSLPNPSPPSGGKGA